MKKAVVGILAHVDAGKTTLAEALLFAGGALRAKGRVDDKNTALDTHALERERGITIFTGQGVFRTGDWEITLLDTPGHVDFSSETERTLQVLDYAVLVISGIDGVQSHTATLWRLLRLYRVPVFIFVTKMDYARRSRAEILAELQREFGEGCMEVPLTRSNEDNESLAMCSEELLEKYLGGEPVENSDIAALVRTRRLFPCCFGSGLKGEGVNDFLQMLGSFMEERPYPAAFGANVFKIAYDKETRLTHLKVTGGTLRVRDTVNYNGKSEKISQIRIYSGVRYETADAVTAGTVCAVCGLSQTESGMGFGFEEAALPPVLEPVMNYRLVLPEGTDVQAMLRKLKKLEEEDPQLHITWNEFLQEIHVGLMGEVQAEILKSLIAERFGAAVTVDNGTVQYKETLTNTVEGVGHYEPLRHYAEVHLLMEPLPRGSGLVFGTKCSEDVLERNWQRLILTHLREKEHLGVLTGSPVTDMRITLAAGRAHIKHTEGGDFRQATYRAVRQGLMQAESLLLEPWFRFRLEIPYEHMGRAISDLRRRAAEIDPPGEQDNMAVLKGKCPVITLNGYAAELTAYTGGTGRLFCENAGYFVCHNPEQVMERLHYRPEADLENTPDSVFCAHGGGFTVKWDKVPDYMHLESCIKKEPPYVPQVNRRNLHIDEKELEAIMLREFGPVKYALYRPAAKEEPQKESAPDTAPRKKRLIVDGYNVIFAWEELKEIAAADLAEARKRLMEILCNYSAYTKTEVVLVFDAYKVPGNTGERFDYHNIHVVYTKERETGDVYIEKLVSEIGKNEQVRVVSSDGLIQLSAVRFGVLRQSAAEFQRETDAVNEDITRFLEELRQKNPNGTVADHLPQA